MSDQQEFWNQKFKKEGFMYGKKPNTFIKRQSHLIKKDGKVLCLAEGEGRNAIYLAREGFKVHALDASEVALQKLASWADIECLNIQATHINLEDWQPLETYDAIVASFMHLPEPLRGATFAKAFNAMNPQGLLIMECFSKDQMLKDYQSGGPKDLELLYNTEELEEIIRTENNIETIQLSQEEDMLDEGWGHQGKASLIRLIFKKV